MQGKRKLRNQVHEAFSISAQFRFRFQFQLKPVQATVPPTSNLMTTPTLCVENRERNQTKPKVAQSAMHDNAALYNFFFFFLASVLWFFWARFFPSVFL